MRQFGVEIYKLSRYLKKYRNKKSLFSFFFVKVNFILNNKHEKIGIGRHQETYKYKLQYHNIMVIIDYKRCGLREYRKP